MPHLMRFAPEAKVYRISWNLSVGAAAALNVHILQSGKKKKNTLRSLFSHPAPTSLRMQPRNDCVCNQSRYFSESILFILCHFCLKLSFASLVRLLERRSRAQSRLILHILFMVTCMKLFSFFLSLLSVILVFRMCIIY